VLPLHQLAIVESFLLTGQYEVLAEAQMDFAEAVQLSKE